MSASATGPNVLVIIADQLNRDVLRAYGGPVPAPGIEQILDAGRVFDYAITTYPMCSPARASLATGLHPHRHGIVHNVMTLDFPAIPSSGHDRGITVADQTTEGLLHRHGYDTRHTGRWHLSDGPLPYYSHWYREFHEYAGEMQERFDLARQNDDYMDWYGWAFPVETAPVILERLSPEGHGANRMGRLKWPPEDTFDYRVASEGIAAIEQAVAANRPFMVTCSFNNPHDPNVAPSPYYEQFDPEKLSLPQSWAVVEERHKASSSWRFAQRLGEAGLREYLRIYCAQTDLLDAQVQRLLATLDRCGVAEDTIVVFMGDHGEMMGSHGMIWKSTDAFYEEVVRVPLAIRWPGQLEPGRDDRCVSLVDIMPTILDAVNIPLDAGVDGRSLLGTDTSTWSPFTVTQRFTDHDPSTREVSVDDQPSIMIRTLTRKLSLYHDGGEELFDLATDPHELANLAGHPAMAHERQALLDELLGWMHRTHHPHATQFARRAANAGTPQSADERHR